MDRRVFLTIFILITFVQLEGVGAVELEYKGNSHEAAICIPCHEKLKSAFEDMPSGIWGGSGCSNCHKYFRTRDPQQRLKGQQLHMGICKGCHPSVHTLHREKDIGCRVCHQSPRGWNSSIVEIPAPRKEDLVVVEGTEIAIPRSSDCGYCHLSARGAVRVHDVHKRIVENICPSCHSGGSTHRWVEVTDNAQEEEKGSSILLIEFLRLFEGISTNLQMLMTSL